MWRQHLKLKNSWPIVVAGMLVALDQWLKFKQISQGATGVSYNPAVGFGLGNSDWFWMGVMAAGILAGLYRLRPLNVWVALIIGLLGTGLDRYYYGAVVDYLKIGQLSFNLTDGLIVSLISYLIWKTIAKDPT